MSHSIPILRHEPKLRTAVSSSYIEPLYQLLEEDDTTAADVEYLNHLVEHDGKIEALD